MDRLAPDPPVRLKPRAADSHKGTFGRVLVIAGSPGLTGAAVLCGSAAVRSGAGLVRVATAAGVQPVVAAGNPNYMTAPVPTGPNGEYDAGSRAVITDAAAGVDTIAAGPGLGHAGGTAELIQAALLAAPGANAVLDADALPVVKSGRPAGFTGPCVITPHPGEFAKLLGVDTKAVQADREKLAKEFAAKHNVVVLLKGHETIVTDGVRVTVNRTGNPGMATGGCGDVLTGVIAGLFGQGLTAFDAAALGTWVQGRAGDLAAAEFGQVALTALDVLNTLPRAFREVGG